MLKDTEFGAKKVIVSAPGKGALEQTCVANAACAGFVDVSKDQTCVANDASAGCVDMSKDRADQCNYIGGHIM